MLSTISFILQILRKNYTTVIHIWAYTAVGAVVNQNGTITFTMSDGSVVTTTGESVIGPKGDNYNLTNQDKSDIADIVLGELPTTHGVQYGN